MTLTADGFLPDVERLPSAKQLEWVGSTAHIGPIEAFTPLQERLLNKTSCGLFLVFIGCVGFTSKRLEGTMDPKLNNWLTEQIFCYQFDWRYAKPYGIARKAIDDNPDKILAIRRMMPFLFFEAIERTSGYFLSLPPVHDTACMANLARHILGPENQAIFDDWMEGIIERVDVLAPCPEAKRPIMDEFDTRAEWEAAVRRNHGTPLPLEVLNLSQVLDPDQCAKLAAAHLEQVEPNENPLLTPVEELRNGGFEGTPYKVG